MTEKELIERLQRGDSSAFKPLVERYQTKVFNTCLGLVQSTEDADDLTQDVFIQVYESIHTFRSDSALSTWIYRIAVNKSLEYIRKRKNISLLSKLKRVIGSEEKVEPDEIEFSHPGVLLEQKEQSEILFRAIRQLPENQRVAFTLHKVEGLSYEEIADVMKSSLSSVESLIFRAKTNLRKFLEAYYNQNK